VTGSKKGSFIEVGLRLGLSTLNGACYLSPEII